MEAANHAQRSGKVTMVQAVPAESLLSGVEAGDAQARERLFDLLAPRVWPMLSRMLPDRKAAAEVMEDAFARLATAAPHLREQRVSLVVWLVVVGRRIALARLRRADDPFLSAEADPDPSAEAMPWLPRPEDILQFEERLALLRKTVQQLPKSQRNVLDAAFFDGADGERLAAILGSPRARALTELRASLSFLRHRLRAILGKWTADI